MKELLGRKVEDNKESGRNRPIEYIEAVVFVLQTLWSALRNMLQGKNDEILVNLNVPRLRLVGKEVTITLNLFRQDNP